jgi:hypothetical protein
MNRQVMLEGPVAARTPLRRSAAMLPRQPAHATQHLQRGDA